MAEDKQLERFPRPNLHKLIKLMYHHCHSTGALGNHELPRRSEICPQNVLTFFLLTLLMTPNGLGKLWGTHGVSSWIGAVPPACVKYQCSEWPRGLVKLKQCQLRCPLQMGWNPGPAEITGTSGKCGFFQNKQE